MTNGASINFRFNNSVYRLPDSLKKSRITIGNSTFFVLRTVSFLKQVNLNPFEFKIKFENLFIEMQDYPLSFIFL